MKKFTLLKKDAYDLSLVVSTIVQEQSEKLDFKEVLHLQKAANIILSSISDFSDAVNKLNEEKNVYVKNANTKISAFKDKLHKETKDKEGVDSDYKEKLDSYVNLMLADAQSEIDKEIVPQYEDLYKTKGNESVEIKLDEEKHKMLVINFELYAKEKYTNKSRMIEIYETLTGAESVPEEK